MLKIWFQETDQYGHIEEKTLCVNNLETFNDYISNCKNKVNIVWVEDLDYENRFIFSKEEYDEQW